MIAGGERRAWGRGDRERARLDPGPARPDRPSPRCARGRPSAQLTPRRAETRPAGSESGCPGPGRDGGQAAAPGTAVLLVTANVGSLFDDMPSVAPDPGSRTPGPRTLSPGTRISVPKPEVPQDQTPSPEPQDLRTRAGIPGTQAQT